MCGWKSRYTPLVKMINKTKTSKGVSKWNGSQQPVQRSVREGSQATSKPQVQVQSLKPLSLLWVSFTLCRQRQLLRGTRNVSSPCEALLSPGNITEALVEQLIWTGIPVIKSQRWLQRDSLTTVRKATGKDYPGQFNYVWKQLQSFMGFWGCCSLDRRAEKERESDMEWAGWEWPVMAGKHPVIHTSKRLRTDMYKASFPSKGLLSPDLSPGTGSVWPAAHPTAPVP